jgi:aminoglycoside phosphotransferase family enzyme/predicted kinase
MSRDGKRITVTMSDSAPQEIVDFIVALDGGTIKIIETHISWVLLGRARAYKIKRAVRFPYLDFSTPQRRLDMCLREFALNRLYASALYLDVWRLVRNTKGEITYGSDGELVDAVVVMRRFPDDALFDVMVREGRLSRELVEELARRIAQFHANAGADFTRGGVPAMTDSLDKAILALQACGLADADETAALAAGLRGALAAGASLLDRRRAQGAVRLCHGDLTLRNICLFEDAPTPFDCLEFSDDIATIDVLYDLAFLLMDFWRARAPDLANVAFNRYLDMRDESDGLPLLPFFLAFRATIRAHVETSQNHRDTGRDYFDLATRLLTTSAPCVIAIGGLSGSGKSSLAAALAPRIGGAPGARILSSDRVRKALFGVASTARLPAAAYTSAISEKVYRTLFASASAIVARGWPVIVDAVFDRPQDRAEIANLALRAPAPFLGVWLEADLASREARVAARINDPSDATVDVLREQMKKDVGEIAWRRLSADADIDDIAARVAAFSPVV